MMFQDNFFRELVIDNFAGGGSAVAYAWFVLQKGYAGATEVRWI